MLCFFTSETLQASGFVRFSWGFVFVFVFNFCFLSEIHTTCTVSVRLLPKGDGGNLSLPNCSIGTFSFLSRFKRDLLYY